MKPAFIAIVRLGILALLACSMLATAQKTQAPSSPSQRMTSGLDLLVVDSVGTAIPKAKVSIADARDEEIAGGLTDVTGKFYVSQFPPGTYQLKVSLAGFQTYAQSLLVQEHAVANLTVTLPATPTLPAEPVQDAIRHGDSGINLAVKDETGAVIAGARVSVIQVSTAADFEGRTGPDGTFHKAGLSSGQYTIWIRVPGFVTVKIPAVTLAPHETCEIPTTMQLAGSTNNPPAPIPNLALEPIVSHLDSELLPSGPAVDALPQGGGPMPVSLRDSKTSSGKGPAPQSSRVKRFLSSLGHKLGF